MTSHDEGTPAVRIAGITKRFGDVVAVDNVDLDISDGEFFALLGPSGCGKTTTLRMIAGLEFPTSGSLQIFGDEVGTLPPNKRPVNTVFQNYALFPHMSVAQNVGFGLKMQGLDKEQTKTRVADALDMVQLGQLAKRRPSQLSGGQQQRVALARALVNRPKVLLLDEPLGALDLKLRQEMQQELKSLQRGLGITFVFVTHDQEEALTMSDRIGIMKDGELLQLGSAEDIYEHPANRFVADFIGQTNLLEATVEDATTICLTNGTRLSAATDHTAGTGVAVSLRPERLRLQRRSDPPSRIEDLPHLTGTIRDVTYLGNALVYFVDANWMELEVRTENPHGADRLTAGDEVTVFWDHDATAIVAD